MKKNNKYLKELGVEFYNCPFGYHEEKPENERTKSWKNQRIIYGFDERETWDLEYTFAIWLYSRVRMYEDISDVNTAFHKMDFKGKEITMEDGIEIIKKGCKRYIDFNPHVEDNSIGEPKEWQDAIDFFTENMRLFWW